MRADTQDCLLAYNRHLLGDIAELLRQLPAAAYTEPLPGYSQATIGKHMRHILEFYECLLQGLPSGVVNYDARKRIPSYETHPGAAIEAAETLQAALSDLPTTDRLEMVTNFDPCSEDAAHPVPTSLNRELAYVYEHTVHHLALVRLALVLVAPTFEVPEGLGVAPATLRSS